MPRTRNDAHKLIEEAMPAANVCSADFIAQGKQHGPSSACTRGPRPRSRTFWRNYLERPWRGMTISDNPQPSEFQAIAEATKDRA